MCRTRTTATVCKRVFKDLWAVDLPACTAWREVPSTPEFPPARIGHIAIAVGSRILVFGGRNFKTGMYADRNVFGMLCLVCCAKHVVCCVYLCFWPHACVLGFLEAEVEGTLNDLVALGPGGRPLL